MFCRNCGAQIDDNAVVCPKCGVPVSSNNPKPVVYDAPSAGFAVLCFFFPILGLILYLVWREESPLKAKSCGKGALIGVCVEVGFSILSVIFTFAFASCLATSLSVMAL